MYTIYTDANQEIMQLRHEIFVIEQGVPLELELEDCETDFLHLCKYQNNQLIAYARVSFKANQGHIGRVVVKKSLRKEGHGRDIMNYAENLVRLCQYKTIVLGAQLQAQNFYSKIGYIPFGDEYMDAGIRHINMKKQL